MVLQVRTTGVEDYLDGGKANIKMLLIGGVGAGKTRQSSFWPKPIYANCEKGLASVADRSVPYVDVKTSKDMFSLIAHVERNLDKYRTLVVDTIDSLQRSLKDQWVLEHGESLFEGRDAWNWLDAQMKTLMARLLNLDCNVVVLAHYKDKTVKDAKGNETREFGLQLQGDIKDVIFGDFDLVGWIETYWSSELVDKEVVTIERRRMTFTKTPDRQFLKDRFHCTPTWLEVTFSEDDFNNLFEAWSSRFEEFSEGEEREEVPDFDPNLATPVLSPAGGPVPDDFQQVVPPLDSLDKQELVRRAKEAGHTVKGNTTKTELVRMLEKPAEPTHDEAVQTVVEGLGGTVISDTGKPAVPVQAPAPAVGATTAACEDCRAPTNPNSGTAKLARVKYKAVLCESCLKGRRK